MVTPHVPVPGAGGGELFAADAAAGVASVAVQMVREGVSAGVALVTDRTSETAVRCRERERRPKWSEIRRCEITAAGIENRARV